MDPGRAVGHRGPGIIPLKSAPDAVTLCGANRETRFHLEEALWEWHTNLI